MKKKANKDEAATVNQLLDAIRTEQRSIDLHEGDVVVCHIRLAVRLAELRQLAKRTWGKQLKTLGMNPRVGRRYLKIAQNWPNEIGLKESALLPRLPTDLLKLEWLCRVSTPQLRELLNNLDCKKTSRGQVIAAVREVLGEDPPSTPDDEVGQFVQRFIKRIARTVGQLGDKFPEVEDQTRARELLAAGLLQVQDTLQSGLPRDDES